MKALAWIIFLVGIPIWIYVPIRTAVWLILKYDDGTDAGGLITVFALAISMTIAFLPVIVIAAIAGEKKED